MRLISAGILVLLMLGCSASKNISNVGKLERTIALDVSDFQMEINNEWFSKTSKSVIDDENTVEEVGEELLEQIITGYSNQTGEYTFVSNNDEADAIISITEIRINRKRLTLNFVKPGPIYQMKIEGNVTTKDGESFIVQKKILANMAEINYPDDNFKWLNYEERGDVDNQLRTFNVGLRKLYQNLFFEVFDISLQL